MASSRPLICITGILVIVALSSLFIVKPAHAITCSDVIKDLQPCINYLRTGSGKPPGPCCVGALNLAASAKSTADKQTACQCIKSTSSSLNVKAELAKALPGNCGISLPFEVSPNTDCSKIG